MKLNQAIRKWSAVIIVGMMTFLSLTQLHPAKDIDVLANESEKTTGFYAESELTAVLPSAYYDARNGTTSDTETQDDKKSTLKTNVNKIVGDNFGNVGLFLGPATEVDNQYTAFNANISVDTNGTSDYFASNDLDSYYHFGEAIHNLSHSARNTSSSNIRFEETLDTLSHSMSTITKLGVRLMKDYDPSPLLFSLYLTEGNSQRTQWMNLPKHVNLNSGEYADNKLVQIVQNNDLLRDGLSLLRRPPMGKGNMTLISWFIFGSVILLIISGTLMTAVNGRAAGENYRKALVRIVIGVVGVPIVAMLLHYGINTFSDVIQPEMTQEEASAEKVIGEHLNLADWYATGFAIPKGEQLTIKDGQFHFTKENVRAINNYTYTMVTKGTGSDPDTATPSPVVVLNRLKSVGSGKNKKDIVFSESSGWDGVLVKVIGNQIKENDEELGDFSVINTSGANYLKSRNTGSTTDGITTITGSPDNAGSTAKEHNFYGVSPLAAHNLMRSSFSGGMISANSRTGNTMTGVAHFVITEDMGKGLNPIVRFLATAGMVIAAAKALATIFVAGFGGIIGGTAGSAMGKTSGMGQAIGGGLAIVGGVLGMGLIMNLSFILLDEMSAILYDMLVGVTGEASMLEPFREAVDSLPKGLGFLKGPIIGVLNTLAGFITFFVTLIVVPKFGKIPITIFGEKMAELPGVFSEKAQLMENRFTGDYRGGSASGRSISRSFTEQAGAAGAASKGQLIGVAAAGGALAGMAASAAGESLSNYADTIMDGDTTGEDAVGELEDKNVDPEGNDNQNAISQEDNFNEDHQSEEDLSSEETKAEESELEDSSQIESLSDEEYAAQQLAEDATSISGEQSMSGQEKADAKENVSELKGGNKESASESLSDKESKEAVEASLDGDGSMVTTEGVDGNIIEGETLSTDNENVESVNSMTDTSDSTSAEHTDQSSLNTDGLNQDVSGGDTTLNQESSLDSGVGGSAGFANDGGAITGGQEAPAQTHDISNSNPAGGQEAPAQTNDISNSNPQNQSANNIGVKQPDSALSNANSKNNSTVGDKKSAQKTNKLNQKGNQAINPSRMRMSSAKVMKAIGKGLQSAGGERTVERGVKAVKLGAISTVTGGAAQKQAQRELDIAQGKTPKEASGSENTQSKSRGNQSQQIRQQRQRKEENERLIEEENARRR